jgi:stage II sporulation protein D
MRGKEILLAIVMGIVLPAILFSVTEKVLPINHTPPTQQTTATEQSQKPTDPKIHTDTMIPVLQSDGTTKTLKLEDYLVGVILGEMPLNFDIEALKAQAVVARTYTLRRVLISQKHDGGAVCVNSACCQSYCPPEQYAGSKASLNKAIAAVASTTGQVITYNGSLIEATYFSCSGGRTEDAQAVWGADIPYLQSVDSPGEENATYYTESVRFASREFANLLGIPLSGDPATWFGAVTYTAGGGVDTMRIGGVLFKGTQLRHILGIRSTAFTITPLGDSVHIVTKGFGHRVGMSQYGAEAMAVAGSDCRQILSHYYPGTELVNLNQN